MSICKVCQGPHRAAVDGGLSGGETVRDVASRFGFSKSAVGRHRTTCLAPRVAAAARIMAPAVEVRGDVERAKAIASGTVTATASEVLGLTGLLDRLARSLERLEGAADAAAGEGLHGALAAVSGQLHRGIETAAKVQGLYAEPQPPNEPRFTVNIMIPGGQTQL